MHMLKAQDRSFLVLALPLCFFFLGAFAGEHDPVYKKCFQNCLNTGYIGKTFFQHCQSLPTDFPGKLAYKQEPLYMRWRQWNCQGDCHYRCMIEREKERQRDGMETVKYHGRWPFKRLYVLQEPVSAVLSALELTMHFHGWLSFLLLVYYKLPLKPRIMRTYYEYTGLWHIYGVLAMNALFWSTILHIQDFDLAERLDCSATAALVGYLLLLAIMRTFNMKAGASKVMLAALLVAFTVTHILYLNVYELDFGLNVKVCFAMAVVQLCLWAAWAGVTSHPARYKMWMVVLGSALSWMALVADFPPYKGYVDAHAVAHILGIPLTYLFWSFVKEDACFQTLAHIHKEK